MSEYMEQSGRTALAEELERGYEAVREEGREMCKEFEAADLEGWDDEY